MVPDVSTVSLYPFSSGACGLGAILCPSKDSLVGYVGAS